MKRLLVALAVLLASALGGSIYWTAQRDSWGPVEPAAPARSPAPATEGVDQLTAADLPDGTLVTVVGTAGDCVDRMVSDSGEGTLPGGCDLRGAEKTLVLADFDANPHRGKTITVRGGTYACSDGGQRRVCALEQVVLVSSGGRRP